MVILKINFEADSPIYEQIITQIKKQVARGELEPGSKLPSQRAMARKLEVNPNTVQRAYREMETRELVETKRGRGTFIHHSQQVVERVKQELVTTALDKFWQEMQSLDYSQAEIVEAVKDYAQQSSDDNGGVN